VPPLPISKRKCTDFLCLLLFLAMWVGLIATAIVGYQQGDPDRLVYGSDYLGRVCGGSQLPTLTYTVYPRPQQDVIGALESDPNALSSPWDISFFSICAASCPVEGDYICTDNGTAVQQEALAQARAASPSLNLSMSDVLYECVDLHNPFVNPSYCQNLANNCWATLFDTTSILHHCLPVYPYNETLMPSSGCIKKQYITVPITGSQIQVCTKYKQVTETTSIKPTGSDVLFDSFNSLYQDFMVYMGDIVKAKAVILLSGVLISLIVGLVYMVILFCLVGVIVWTSVIALNLISIAFTIYLYVKAGVLTVPMISAASAAVSNAAVLNTTLGSLTGINLINATDQTVAEATLLSNGTALDGSVLGQQIYATDYLYMAYVLTAVSGFLLFLTLILIPKIRKAILIFREASEAIVSNFMLILVPFCAMPVAVMLIIFWMSATLYLASAGSYDFALTSPLSNSTLYAFNTTITPADSVVQVKGFGVFSYNEGLIAFQLLGYLWSAQFVSGVVIFIVSGTTGHWYWNGQADSNDSYGRHPLRSSIYVVFRFHMGTLAFGSLLIAVVQLIRYIAAYLEAKTSTKATSRIVQVLWCMLHYCLKCIDMCVKFISQNAFIMCALYGEPFCTSAKMAFSTVMHNLLQVGTVTFLGDIVVRFGQFLITMSAAMCCWLYLDHDPEFGYGGALELNSFWWPTCVTAFLAFFVAHEMLSLYSITVDTLLLCYCQDTKLAALKPDHQQQPNRKIDDFIDKESDAHSRTEMAGAMGQVMSKPAA